MSYADLLRKFAEHPVTPVTPSNDPEVTEKPKQNQRSNLSYLGNPKKPTKLETEHNLCRAEALLSEIAQTLKTSPNMLRSLLSDDDMGDIAEGVIKRSHLIAYFRLMRSDGISLTEHEPLTQRTSGTRDGHVQSMQAWKSAHEDLLNHIMACSDCYAPLKRYCERGASLRGAYIDLCTDSKTHC